MLEALISLDLDPGLRNAMSALRYCVDAENGHHVDNPSPQELVELIGGLNRTDNTFVTVLPDEDDPWWYASVSRLDEGTYEVEYRDLGCEEHRRSTLTDREEIVRDLTVWLAARGDRS
ncbi:hypothetical protein ACGFIJ_29225 [Microbispora bryophytorum]|uniref:hypothetical protein n=1 Tax=Microbispora bryophytorum TaxID=1460882 RepID=UPI003718507B